MKTIFWFWGWFHTPQTKCRAFTVKDGCKILDATRVVVVVVFLILGVALSIYAVNLENPNASYAPLGAGITVVWLLGVFKNGDYVEARKSADSSSIDLKKWTDILVGILLRDILLVMFWTWVIVLAIVAIT